MGGAPPAVSVERNRTQGVAVGGATASVAEPCYTHDIVTDITAATVMGGAPPAVSVERNRTQGAAVGGATASASEPDIPVNVPDMSEQGRY